MPTMRESRLSPSQNSIGPMTEPIRTLPPSYIQLLRISVSLALLALIINQVDLVGSWDIFRRARPELVALMFGLTIIDRFLAAYRWYVSLQGIKAGISFGQVAHTFFVSNALGIALPGNLGTEAIRIFGLSRADSSNVTLALTSVFMERVTALLALTLLVLFGLALSPFEWPQAIGYMAWLFLVLLGLGIAAIMMQPTRALAAYILRSEKWTRIRTWLEKLYGYLDAYKGQPRLVIWSGILAILFQLGRVIVVFVGAWALDIDISFIYLLILVPIIVLITLLPISIAGLGVREVSFIYLFGLVGVNEEAALTLSLLGFAMNMFSIVPGYWLYLRHGFTAGTRRND